MHGNKVIILLDERLRTSVV